MSKNIKLLAVFTISLLLASCTTEPKNEGKAIDPSISKIEVFNFHSTHRCKTCNAIEANTAFTLKTYFEDELKNGKITVQVINVDEKENEDMAEKFEASGTALVLNVIKSGKENAMNLTDFAFMEGNDKEAFSKELKTKIDAELKTL